MTIERETATRLAHQEHVAATLARTGGEVIHPDHYDLREAIRIAVVAAIDETTDDLSKPAMSDGELPALFRALDRISERIFLKSVGL